MELMEEYGMKPAEILKSATSVNAAVFGYGDRIGSIRQGMLADIIAVEGDPSQNIKNIRQTVFLMKGGVVYLNSYKIR
jgi:imidazolonepropionase-like amidohydrolase